MRISEGLLFWAGFRDKVKPRLFSVNQHLYEAAYVLFPGDNEKRIVLVIVSWLSGFLLGAITVLAEINLKDYFPSLVTLVAAGTGAWAANWLQKNRSKQEEINNRVEAGNKAMLALMSCHDRFFEVEDQGIKDHRNSPIRFVQIQPIIGESTYQLDFKFDSLAFLIKSKSPDILHDLSALQAEVESTISLIKHRSERYRNAVRPVAERHGFRHDQTFTKPLVEDALGYALCKEMEILTDDFVEAVDGIVEETARLGKELNGILKTEFPGHVILNMKKT